MVYPLRIHFVLFAFLVSLATTGQDVHFSQYGAAPLNINPGFTGQFDGRYRIMANQRTQWRSVTVPYSTFAFAGDLSSLQYKTRSSGGEKIHTVNDLGLGALFLTDKTGDSQLQTTLFNVAASYRIHLSPRDVVIPGVLTGFTFRKIDYSQLSYDNQWTGIIYDPGINPNENFGRDAYTNFNFQMGFLWTHYMSQNKLESGMGIYHLSLPGQSFFNNPSVTLDPRITLHSTLTLELNPTWTLEPSFLFMSQGKFTEFDLGATAYMAMPSAPFEKHRVFGGVFFRTRDAGFLVAGLEYDAWRAGLSYDFNLSGLRPASNGRGGLELSLSYIIDWPPSVSGYKKYCPDYM